MVKNNYNTRKPIRYPVPSEKLAEFIGIFLGDGSFRNKYQITISYNYRNEKGYAVYIKCLITNLFGLEARQQIREKYGSADLVITGSNLVDFLLNLLDVKSIREKNSFTLPKWVGDSDRYKIAFVRGLFDTEGCIYRHKYLSNKKVYSYLKIAITNYLAKILNLLNNLLQEIGFHPVTYRNRVYLYSQKEVNSFLALVGTNNDKNKIRLKRFAL